MAPDRGELLTDLADRMTRAGESIPGSWTGFAVVAEITALGVRVTGFRYDGDAPGLPILMDTDAIQAIADLRLASPGPHGELFDIYVARLERAGARILDQAFTNQTGALYRVTARSVTTVAELVRPGPPYLPVAPPTQSPPPAPPVPPAIQAQPEPAPQAQPVPEPMPEPVPEPGAGATTPADTAALTAAVVGWVELAGDDWTGYGAAAAFWPRVLHTVGFRYGPDGAVPTYVGGDFHRQLRAYRDAADAHARDQGSGQAPAGAALLRMLDRTGPVQVRLIYPPASDAIRWDGPDAELARRLAPPTAPNPTLIARPHPDRLEPGELVDRISADVSASLRSRDDWTSFAMAFDASGQRSAAFLYHDDGSSEGFRLPLPVVIDLSELRDQTARPDGSRWVGAVLQSWAGTDRVDLSFWNQSGIDAFLADAAGNNGQQMRPAAPPPEHPPAAPWPEVGGYLDRDRLLSEVTARIGQSPELVRPDWDRLAVVISFGDGAGTEVRGLRYLGVDGPVAETVLDDVGPIGKLRRTFRTPNGNLPDVLVLGGHRGGPGLDVHPLFGSAADDLTALPTGPLIDRVRPT